MREFRSLGSVRGAPGNRRSYRDGHDGSRVGDPDAHSGLVIGPGRLRSSADPRRFAGAPRRWAERPCPFVAVAVAVAVAETVPDEPEVTTQEDHPLS